MGAAALGSTGIPGASAWDEVRAFFRGLRQWLTSKEVEAFVADASVFLLFGGLAMLALLIALVVVQSLAPAPRGRPDRGQRWEVRSLKPLSSLGQGSPSPADLPESGRRARKVHSRARRAGRSGRDRVLEAMELRGLGRPRILNLSTRGARVRVYDCAPCVRGEGSCSAPALFLRDGLSRAWETQVRITESECRREGRPVCDFEVSRA